MTQNKTAKITENKKKPQLKSTFPEPRKPVITVAGTRSSTRLFEQKGLILEGQRREKEE